MPHGIYNFWQPASEVQVQDALVDTIRHPKPEIQKRLRTRWRRSRDRALAAFAAPTRIAFRVTEVPGRRLPGWEELDRVGKRPVDFVPAQDGVLLIARVKGERGWASTRDGLPLYRVVAGVAVCHPFEGYACHEIGHTLGLTHRGDAPGGVGPPGGCMDYENQFEHELPDEHDLEELQRMYGVT